MTLLVGDADDNLVTVTGAVPEAARTHSLTSAEAEQRLRKSGGTAFSVEQCVVRVGEGLSVSAASLNAMRRDALAALAEKRVAVPERRTSPYVPPETIDSPAAAPRFTVSLMRAEQLTDRLVDAQPEMIYLPVGELSRVDLLRYGGATRFCAVLPRVYRTQDEGVLKLQLADAPRRGVSAVAIGNLGHLRLAENCELEKRGDLSLNVFNSAALRLWRERGLATAAVSFELRREQIRDLQKCLPCEAVVYGRLPLMIAEHLAAQELIDRRGERFPVLALGDGRGEIENAKTLYLADRGDWRDIGLSLVRLRFTTETPETCADILRAHVEGRDCAPEDLTRGLFYRGVG